MTRGCRPTRAGAATAKKGPRLAFGRLQPAARRSRRSVAEDDGPWNVECGRSDGSGGAQARVDVLSRLTEDQSTTQDDATNFGPGG